MSASTTTPAPKQAAPPAGPARVAASEAELLTLARAIVGGGSARFVPLLRRRRGAIGQIGPTAMGLLQQTLARGVSQAILRLGGWQSRRTIAPPPSDADAIRSGRLWQRHPELPPLHFTAASFELLTWMHREDVASPKKRLEAQPQSLADELLHYLALEPLDKAGAALDQPAFASSALCQLGYADRVAFTTAAPDYARWVEGPGAVVLEALQDQLSARWQAMETSKGELFELQDMIGLGERQGLALDGLFAAIEASEDLDDGRPARRDLASFLVEAGVALLASGPERRCPTPQWWTQMLDLRASLSQRQAAFRGAATYLRALAHTLGRWVEDAGLVAHFDEDYAAAQLLLTSWRPFHETLERDDDRPVLAHGAAPLPGSVLGRARAIAASLESLHSLGGSSSD